jgi:SAM-dependent methyltransferase
MGGETLSCLRQQEEAGVTGHFGGPEATGELIRLCAIRPRFRVLDAGCGTGRTACLLAKKFGCVSFGIDASPKMVSWCKERAVEEDASENTRFLVADARRLPFRDGFFDAVLCESLLAFIPGKRAALAEFARVAKPGGAVGVNEPTWLKPRTPKAVKEYFRALDENEGFFTRGGWIREMRRAGLADISGRQYAPGPVRQALESLRLQGLKRSARGLLSLLSHPSDTRLIGAHRHPEGMLGYRGYGIYIARKPA